MLGLSKFTKRKGLRGVLFDQEAVCSGIGMYLFVEIFWCANLHLDAKIGKLTTEQLSDLYDICKRVVEGHYKNTRQKVIYHQKIDPNGNKIESKKMCGRTFWWVPTTQTLGI